MTPPDSPVAMKFPSSFTSRLTPQVAETIGGLDSRFVLSLRLPDATHGVIDGRGNRHRLQPVYSR
jgi:hypothetical protein